MGMYTSGPTMNTSCSTTRGGESVVSSLRHTPAMTRIVNAVAVITASTIAGMATDIAYLDANEFTAHSDVNSDGSKLNTRNTERKLRACAGHETRNPSNTPRT
eukprot:Amastigsp_a341044_12.p8 type:complete len:103 gc:universal Amastigsp_a341044_12:983-1291(+)